MLQSRDVGRRQLAGAILAVAVALPASGIDSGPVLCPVRHVTGRLCPGCGLTRSVVKTVHGRPRQAFADHPAGPVLVALLIAWLLRRTHTGVLDPGSWTATPRRRVLVVAFAATWLGWAAWRSVHRR